MKKKLIFIGNSIVNGFPFSRGKSFPGHIRAAIKSGEAGFAADIINKGVNGQTTDQILSRFDSDVIAHDPDAVFIMTGTNDFIFGESRAPDAFSNLEKMALIAKNAGVTPIHLTPLLVDAAMAKHHWMVGLGIDYDRVNEEIGYLSDLIRNGSYIHVDTNAMYRDFSGDVTSSYAGSDDTSYHAYIDGVHPTADGYEYLGKKLTLWIDDRLEEL